MKDAYGRAVMTFGKFRGEPLEKIPEGYLRWLLTDCNSLEDDLRVAIERKLRGQDAHGSQSGERGAGAGQERVGPDTGLPTAVDRAVAAEIIAAGRRALALAHHPDRGGDAERMMRINATADYLTARLAAVLGG